MKSYVQGTILKKYWGWFENPHEVGGFSAATFFSYDKSDVQGFHCKETLTSVIDLSKTLEEIYSAMRKSFIQKQIEQGARRGIVAEESDDFSSFYPLYADFAQRMGFERIPRFVLEKNGTLFLAHREGKLLAGGVFIGDGKHLRAWVLASKRLKENQGRERDLIGGANRIIVWEAIKFAKKTGHQVFDLGGIAPDSDNAGWKAVAEFKEAFGGKRIPAYYYHKLYSPLLRFKANIRRYLPI